jgi:hypothetical protein
VALDPPVAGDVLGAAVDDWVRLDDVAVALVEALSWLKTDDASLESVAVDDWLWLDDWWLALAGAMVDGLDWPREDVAVGCCARGATAVDDWLRLEVEWLALAC